MVYRNPPHDNRLGPVPFGRADGELSQGWGIERRGVAGHILAHLQRLTRLLDYNLNSHSSVLRLQSELTFSQYLRPPDIPSDVADELWWLSPLELSRSCMSTTVQPPQSCMQLSKTWLSNLTVQPDTCSNTISLSHSVGVGSAKSR